MTRRTSILVAGLIGAATLAGVAPAITVQAHHTTVTCARPGMWRIENSEPLEMTFTSDQNHAGSIGPRGFVEVPYSGTSLTVSGRWSNGVRATNTGTGDCRIPDTTTTTSSTTTTTSSTTTTSTTEAPTSTTTTIPVASSTTTTGPATSTAAPSTTLPPSTSSVPATTSSSSLPGTSTSTPAPSTTPPSPPPPPTPSSTPGTSVSPPHNGSLPPAPPSSCETANDPTDVPCGTLPATR